MSGEGMLTQRDKLKISSVLLAYPDGEEFRDVLEDVRSMAEDAGDVLVLAAVNGMESLTNSELVLAYVATFDFKESMALYLTAHELGDSRERGNALLHLHAMLRSAALEPLEGELPDYLPLLFEFLAEKPNGMPTEELENRLATVTRSILERLPDDNPYRPLFEVIVSCFQQRQDASGDGAEVPLFAGVEGAVPSQVASSSDRLTQPPDIDNLPYPLVYD